MTYRKQGRSERVLILTPSANDGQTAVDVLSQVGIDAHACSSMEELCTNVDFGCGALLISEEALDKQSMIRIQSVLEIQEAWSDIPMLLLTSVDLVRAAEIFSKTGNISLLERPFSRLTLIRSIEVALRARRRQYQVRDLMEELRAAKEDAELAKVEAETATMAKSQFLANMSHEIRTPIGAISGFVELIKNAELGSPDSVKYMGIVERNSKHLLRLIDDILDLSKVEAGKMVIESIAFRLDEFLADFFANMNFRANEKGLRFSISYQTKLPQQVECDPMRLRQILSNVVGNAIKFTEKGAVDVVVSYEQPQLIFSVFDSGIGLSTTQADRLFQPFAQADETTTRRFGGTGLGLILSRRLAEALGGTLELKHSAPGKGSTFEIKLNAPAISEEVLVPHEKFVQKAPTVYRRNSLAELKILLVEDSVDNQVLIGIYLRETGAVIDVRDNGRVGVEAALRGDYDVVLMDVQMPVMDGHEATQKLRSLGYIKPIIALTAHAMKEEKAKCFQSGFTDYITKPVHRDLLVETIERHCSDVLHSKITVPSGDDTYLQEDHNLQ